MTTEFEREASSFRPDRRPFIFGLLANVLLAFLFIGLPYMRARIRASDARHAFGEFAACFLGGETVDDPGLALPIGEREHFAHLVMHGPRDWPARCDASLTEISPEGATFLFPSVKQADAETRAAIDLMRKESKVLRGGNRAELGHIPGRPLLAFSRLRSALAMLLDAAGDAASIDHDAIHLDVSTVTIVGTRVPLTAANGGVLQLRTEGGLLEAHSLDSRGLSWVAVHDGEVDRHRPKRSRLLRALALVPEPLLVWALTESRCAELEHGCSHRAMGAKRLGQVRATLPEPQWLTAHPPGRPDRHMRLLDDHLWVTALDDGPAKREIRVFTLEADTKADAEPTGATKLWNLGATAIRDSLLLPTTPPQLVTATVDTENSDGASSVLELRIFEPTEGSTAIATLQGTKPFVLGCVSQAVAANDTTSAPSIWLAMFTDKAAVIAHPSSSAAAPARLVLPNLRATADQSPFHAEDPARDRIRLLCDGERAVVITLDDKHVLQGQTCDNNGQCGPSRKLGANVSHFSAVLRGDDLIVATAGDNEHAQVYMQRFDALLAALGPRQAPVPCWQPTEGLCGQPYLAQDDARVVMAARDQGDLLAIESGDSGATWQPLTGLKVGDTPAPDSTIMDIHRDRKRYSH